MKAEWTVDGGATVTLADDEQQHRFYLESLSGQAVVQIEPLFRAAHPAVFGRGNVGGQCSFRSAKSHATREAAMGALGAEYARIGEGGLLLLTYLEQHWKMAGARLKGVSLVSLTGLRLELRYEFAIGTLEIVT